MATNPNPTIQAIKDSKEFANHEHRGISRKARRFMRIPTDVKQSNRKTGRYALTK